MTILCNTGTQSNNSLDTQFESLWAPFTVLGPWDPGIAGAADG